MSAPYPTNQPFAPSYTQQQNTPYPTANGAGAPPAYPGPGSYPAGNNGMNSMPMSKIELKISCR